MHWNLLALALLSASAAAALAVGEVAVAVLSAFGALLNYLAAGHRIRVLESQLKTARLDRRIG